MPLKGNGMIYELDKDYHMDTNIQCRSRGYHYFESLRDCMLLYKLTRYRVFECELDGDMFDHDKNVHCTNHIRLTREISQDEIKKYIEDNLDTLLLDEYPEVRIAIASYGCALDILINDDHTDVRLEVAGQGYGLDKLLYDEDWIVRYELARQGYRLDILVNDVDADVRSEVAKQGYGLDILINDDHWAVLYEVARQSAWTI